MESNNKRILMIEDGEIFIEMFGDRLKQEGYAMEFATNGAWGLKEALSKDFDLLIIDMLMPAMTGEEMIIKLKADEKTKNIPIIVLSASVDHATQKKVEAMGISAFYIKTHVTPSELAKKVGEIFIPAFGKKRMSSTSRSKAQGGELYWQKVMIEANGGKIWAD